MADVELTALSLEELRELAADVQRETERREEQVRQEAMAKIQALADEAGISLAGLVAASSRKRSKIPPKYRNPDDPDRTWSGRGKKPRWLEAALEAGGSLEDFAIG